MTRRDYVAVAEIIKKHQDGVPLSDQWIVTDIGHDLADLMERDNPNFDRARFCIAAGIPRDKETA